jgi:hypothetical protein
MPVQNLIPVTLGIIIVRLVWIIYFFVWVAVDTKQEGAAFPSWIISVRNVEPCSTVRSNWFVVRRYERNTPNSDP